MARIEVELRKELGEALEPEKRGSKTRGGAESAYDGAPMRHGRGMGIDSGPGPMGQGMGRGRGTGKGGESDGPPR